MTIAPQTHVADLVLEQPGRTTVFERYGIDYCCGGRIPLTEACATKGVDLHELMAALAAAPTPVDDNLDLRTIAVADLAGHIVEHHHGYLREELPGLGSLVEKVSRVHGGRRPALREVAAVYGELAEELTRHLADEEEIVFPACTSADPAARETLAAEVERMEADHDAVGAGLAHLRSLTDGYTPPEDACTSYRAMLQRLAALERDVHLHVHKENNVLFPRALATAGRD